MNTWSLFNEAGRKVAQFTGREMDAALNTPAEYHMIAGDINGETQYFDGATVLARPVLSLPATHSIAANTTWTITGVPDGTEVLTDNVVVGTTDGSDLDLTFPETGVWRVDLHPPFPWRDATSEVTVT